MPIVCWRIFVVLLWLSIDISMVSASDVIETDTIVITGTRTEKTVLETPVRTEVVTRKEIEKTHARDVKEALENVPGLMVKGNAKDGFVAWLQGFNADRVLVVVDGEPITPSTGSSVDLSQLSTMDIERIEIVKGATAALYGSSAMGGVINIITRKPEQPLTYRLSIDGGSFGDHNLNTETDIATRNIAGMITLKQPRWSLMANASMRDKTGYDLDKNTFEAEGAEGDKTNIGLRLTFTPDKQTEYFIAPRYYREDLSGRFATRAPGVGNDGYINKIKREEAQRIHTTFGAEQHWQDGSRLHHWLVLDSWRDVTQQDVITTPQIDQQRNAKINIYRFEVQWDHPLGDRHLITAGLLTGLETMSQSKEEQGELIPEVPQAERRNVEAYLQDDIFLNKHWEMVPGLRIQKDSDFGFEATPKINVMFTPNWFDDVTTNVRISYGNGYRVPSLKERHYVFDHSALGYRVFGSSDLQPEQSHSYQLGIEFARPGLFFLDVGLFYNRITDLIESRFIHMENDIRIYTFSNIARAITRGIETTAKYRFSPGFSINTGITWLETENLDTNEPLVGRPERIIKSGLDYEYKPWGTTFTLRGIHQSKEWVNNFSNPDALARSPAWTTWDIKLNQPLTEGLTLFAGIDNITDEHRNPNDNNDARPYEPRLVYLGLRIKR